MQGQSALKGIDGSPGLLLLGVVEADVMQGDGALSAQWAGGGKLLLGVVKGFGGVVIEGGVGVEEFADLGEEAQGRMPGVDCDPAA